MAIDPADKRKKRAMSDCERQGAIDGNQARSRLTGEDVRRMLFRAAVLPAACVLASACSPLTDTLAPRDRLQTVAAGAPSPGRIYADTACASCHAVAAGQTRSPNPKAPSFEKIANVPGMTLMALNVALHTSHKTMPNLIVAPDRIEDLSAYLYTLKK